MIRSILQIGLVYIALVVVTLGCDDGEIDETLYTISTVTPDRVPVTIDGDIGTIQFDLSQDPATDEEYEAFLSYLTGDPPSITLLVMNNVTNVNFSLVEGTLVEELPSGMGEYQLSYSNEIISVAFWNDFQGYKVDSDGDYSAFVNILDNSYFATEEFMRPVDVQ